MSCTHIEQSVASMYRPFLRTSVSFATSQHGFRLVISPKAVTYPRHLTLGHYGEGKSLSTAEILSPQSDDIHGAERTLAILIKFVIYTHRIIVPLLHHLHPSNIFFLYHEIYVGNSLN